MFEDVIPTIVRQFQTYGIRPHFMPNAIGLWPNEWECLLWCALNAPEGKWIEIGAFCGGSTVLLAHARRKRYGTEDSAGVITVDKKFEPVFDRNVFRNGRFFDVVDKREIASDDLELGDVPVSFAFIDGFHSFRQVVNDFDIVFKNLVPGGIVAFHDVSPRMTEEDIFEFEAYCDKIAFNVEVNKAKWYNSQEEDFRVDEAIVYLMDLNPIRRIDIPVRREITHFKETGLTEWKRGTTSPFNALCAVVRSER